MAREFITLDTRIDGFKTTYNNLTTKVGDLANLNTTGDSDLVQAINEMHDSIGEVAIVTTTATTIKGSINEHDAELGTISSGAMGTTASTVSTAIAELDSRLDSIASTQLISPRIIASDSSGTSVFEGNLQVDTNVTFRQNLTVDSADITNDLTVGGTTTMGGDLELGSNDINAVTNVYVKDAIIHDGDTNTTVNFGTDAINIKTGGTDRVKVTDTDTQFTHAIRIDDSAYVSGNFDIGGDATIAGTLTVDGAVTFKAGSSGSIELGDANTDNVVFTADVNSHIIPNTDGDYDLGSSSQEWNHGFFDGTVNADRLLADSATIAQNLVVGGQITGNASSATVGTNVNVTKNNTEDSDLFLTFVDATSLDADGSGQRIEVDSDLTYNPSTNMLTANLTGNVTGNADSATVATNVFATASTANADRYVTFLDGPAGTQGIETHSALVYRPHTSTLVTNITGNVTGNVTGSVTGAQTGITSLGTLTQLTVDNIFINGNEISSLDTNGNINITPQGVGNVILNTEVQIKDSGAVTGISYILADSATFTGPISAASLDIGTGGVDVNGTLEANAITIGGTTLAETIATTVGDMVSGNTETDITVSFNDGDNTLDFVVSNISGTAGTATNVTATANNTANEEVYLTFVDGKTGAQGIETDSDLTYRPNTNTLTANLTGNVTGNVTGNTSGTAATVTGSAQTAIESLGTLTALQVDNLSFDGTTISTVGGTDLNITPVGGQQIVLDGAINVDAGVVTGATSITTGELVVDTMNFNAALITGTQEISVDATYAINLDVGANSEVIFKETGTNNIEFAFPDHAQRMLFRNAHSGSSAHPTIRANHASQNTSTLVFSTNSVDSALSLADNMDATFGAKVTTVGDATIGGKVTTSGAIELGHASDTTIARSSAGVVTIEGNVIYRAGGTDVPITDGGTGSSSASGARTNLGLGALATLGTVNNDYWSGTDLAVANGGTGSSTASGARTNLGLGSLATLSTISNDNWSGTDLAVANGGTGASTASGARDALDVQVYIEAESAGTPSAADFTNNNAILVVQY